jgi:predicted MPP superfamily phosphohydrolase
MMPLPYRALVSIPASFLSAGTLLAWPWAVLYAFGFNAWGAWLPYTVALLGVVQSLSARRAEEVDVVVGDGHAVDTVSRHRSPKQRVGRPLRIFQITDPHLGPFMSQARLRRICERAVRREPDLVLLTGDFLTMESQSDPAVLAQGLEPLRALSGRVFACMGNHDHEAADTVSEALRRVGARLLVDEAAELETAAGPVQIVGIDFRWRGRRRHIREVCAAFPRKPDVLRVVLLHDPSAFHHIPDGDADLVFSGHTHGGQVGLVSIGLPFTMLRLFVRSPDHGLWAFGRNRLYVHRGTGHYGFPLRVGVPAEESIVRVHDARLVAPAE